MSLPLLRIILITILAASLGCTKQSRLHLKAVFGGRVAKREYGEWLFYHGRSRETAEGLQWITKAAEAGDTEAMYSLASIKSAGGDTYGAFPESVMWFRKGADAGDRFCMIKLANAYEYGYLGLTIDKAEANKWFEAARRAKKPGEM